MLDATLYIIVCSAKNRVRRWVSRLREPRYLIGAGVGAAYLYFTIYSRARASRFDSSAGVRGGARRLPSRSALGALVQFVAAAPALTAALVLVVALLCWFVPAKGTLLDFSSAEVQLLFPAPASRRQLVLYRLMRSQLGLLFASVVSALLLSPRSGWASLRIVFAIWILLATSRMYLAGVGLARAHVVGGAPEARRFARTAFALVAAALVVVATAYVRAFGAWGGNVADLFAGLRTMSFSGLPGIALWPALAVVAPLFTNRWSAFFLAVPSAVLVLAAAAAWVVASDEVFHRSDVDAEGEERVRRASVGTAEPARKIGLLRLAPAGRPEGALAWKGALQTFRTMDRRFVVRLTLVLVWVVMALGMTGRARGLVALAGVLAVFAAMFTVLVAPLGFRADLRRDLDHLEMLKTWPISAGAVVRGELIWPVTALSAVASALIGAAWFLSASVFPRTAPAGRLSFALAALLVAPALIAAQYAVHTAAALLFPAWVHSGGRRARGLDAMGQRLIVFGGALLVVGLLALPGAAIGGLTWLAFPHWARPAAAVPAALICSMVILGEVFLLVEALGPAYDRLDLACIEPADT